jgi:hypothetical protein
MLNICLSIGAIIVAIILVVGVGSLVLGSRADDEMLRDHITEGER